MVVMWSMEKRRGRDGLVKYGTSRKVRSTYTILWDNSPDAGADITLASASIKGRFVATCNPSEGRWYQFFALGCCARMGDVVRQDRAFTSAVLHKLLAMCDAWHADFGNNMPLNSMYSCMFLLLTCLGGMRGFEAVWTDLAALRYDLT